ncbi:MAG: ChuX/HutX family heme-like substrate-binding protein [Verrucomicrobiales bacterium]
MSSRDPVPDRDLDFEPKPAGKVLQLSADWESLLPQLASLRPSAVTYRNRHSIVCRPGFFPALTIVEDGAFRNDGYSGYSLRLDHCAEAWWYEEHRFGGMHHCLEVADSLGRGMFKLCYRDREVGLKDRESLTNWVVEEASAWDLLHLKPSNQMDCSATRRLCGKPRFRLALEGVFREASERQVELGFLFSGEGQSMWDSFVPSVASGSCCWTVVSHGQDFIHLEPAGFHRAEVFDEGGREVVVFRDRAGNPALTLVVPDGMRFESIRRLKGALPRINP